MKKIVTRYATIANDISSQISAGVLLAGERIPSVRAYSRTRGFSSNTVLRAYHLLEDRGEIAARARSGYYVLGAPAKPAADASAPIRSKAANAEDLAFEVFETTRLRNLVHFGHAWPSAQLYPLKRTRRCRRTTRARMRS